MRKKSVMTSSYAYPSACTDRAGKDQVDSAREGTGNPRNAACVFVLAKRKPVNLEAANVVYPVKILNFVCLTTNNLKR